MAEPKTAPNLIIHESCRVCRHKPLEPIISLGMQSLIDFIDSKPQKIFVAPLDLVFCNKKKGGCGLLQLKHTVPADLLYRKFWYKSGVNQTMRDALSEIVERVEKLVNLQSKDIVVDIGSNDGTLLRSYSVKDLLLVGFDPATNLLEEAKKGTTKIINDFFNFEKFNHVFGRKKANVVTSIAMFYDLEEPNKFVEDIVKILDKDGAFIIQMNYLKSMLENNAFDNIVHEHIEYYSLKSLEYLLEKHNLVVFDVELNEINGGSIRAYIKHKDCKKYHIKDQVSLLRKEEEEMGLEDQKIYKKFAQRINNLKGKTYEFIKREVVDGKKVYVYGASTRGSTLLQFFNLDHKLIQSAADRNPTKWGKKIVGTEIPIISEEQARIEKPDYFLVLPWYFLREFKIREQEYLDGGGKFIVPLPSFKIIGSN